MLSRDQIANAAIAAAFAHEPATAVRVQDVVQQIFATLDAQGCRGCGMPVADAPPHCSACLAEAAAAEAEGSALTIHLHEAIPEGLPEVIADSDKPFARVGYYSEPGESDAGIPPLCGWFLLPDQEGTLLADLIGLYNRIPVLPESLLLFEREVHRIESEAQHAAATEGGAGTDNGSLTARYRAAIERRTQRAVIERLRDAMKVSNDSPLLHQQQALVGEWVTRAFGTTCAANLRERVARVLEEAMELAQAEGLSLPEALTLATYVFGRPLGEPDQEVGGVMVTLLAYAAVRTVRLGYLRGRFRGDVGDGGHALHPSYRAMAEANGVRADHPALSECRSPYSEEQKPVNGRTEMNNAEQHQFPVNEVIAWRSPSDLPDDDTTVLAESVQQSCSEITSCGKPMAQDGAKQHLGGPLKRRVVPLAEARSNTHD